MKALKYIGLFFIFLFFYTFGISLDVTRQLNVANLAICLVVFVLWVLAWYFFTIKNILKSDEKEKNGIVLLLVLLGIIFFFYNPLPHPENFYINIPRVIYFIYFLIVFTVSLVIFRKENYYLTIIVAFLPSFVQSFLINVLGKVEIYNEYPNLTLVATTILFILLYLVKIAIRKRG